MSSQRRRSRMLCSARARRAHDRVGDKRSLCRAALVAIRRLRDYSVGAMVRRSGPVAWRQYDLQRDPNLGIGPKSGGHTCLRFRLCLANTAWVLSARRPSFKRLGSRDVPGFDLAMAMSTCDCGRVVRGRDKADEETVVVVRYEGEFPMEVKGESHYQEAIRECVAGASAEISSDDACSCEFSVRLVREPENPHDANAVAVRSLGDRTLGYLPRAVAPEYALVLDRLHGFAVVECSARAYGRRDRSGDPWNFGIWLDLPDASEFAHAVDLGYETIRGTNGRERDAIHADSGTEPMVAVSCPACGAVAEAAPGVGWVSLSFLRERCLGHQLPPLPSAVHDLRLRGRRAAHSSSAAGTAARRTWSTSRAFARSMLRSAGGARGGREPPRGRDGGEAERGAARRGSSSGGHAKDGRVQAELAALPTCSTGRRSLSTLTGSRSFRHSSRSLPGAARRGGDRPGDRVFPARGPAWSRWPHAGRQAQVPRAGRAANRAFAEASEQHEARTPNALRR